MEKQSFEEKISEDLLYTEPGPHLPGKGLEEILYALKQTYQLLPPAKNAEKIKEKFDPLKNGMEHFVTRLVDTKRRDVMMEQMQKGDHHLTQCYLLSAVQARITQLIFQ